MFKQCEIGFYPIDGCHAEQSEASIRPFATLRVTVGRVGIIFFLGMVMLWWAVPTVSYATDGIISAKDTKVEQDKIEAVIIHDGQSRETMIMRMSYTVTSGNPQSFGWVVATPRKPKITTVSSNIFTQLKELTIPKTNYNEEVFAIKKPILTATFASNTTITRVGAYDIAIISAYEQQNIRDWAGKFGFNGLNLYSPAIREYVADGWYFVLIRLAADKAASLPPSGTTPPVAFTYENYTPMLTWRIMADANNTRGDTKVLSTNVYVLAPTYKYTNQNARAELGAVYAENLPEEVSRSLVQGLDMVSYQPYYLTQFSGDVPSWEVQDQDINFVRAGEQTEVNSGRLQNSDWIVAVIATLFYGSLVVFATFWILFTNSISGIIIGGTTFALIYAFLKPEKPRRLVIFILSALGFLLASGVTIAAVTMGSPALILFSIIPSAAFLVWMGKRAFVDEEGKQLFI